MLQIIRRKDELWHKQNNRIKKREKEILRKGRIKMNANLRRMKMFLVLLFLPIK